MRLPTRWVDPDDLLEPLILVTKSDNYCRWADCSGVDWYIEWDGVSFSPVLLGDPREQIKLKMEGDSLSYHLNGHIYFIPDYSAERSVPIAWESLEGLSPLSKVYDEGGIVVWEDMPGGWRIRYADGKYSPVVENAWRVLTLKEGSATTYVDSDGKEVLRAVYA